MSVCISVHRLWVRLPLEEIISFPTPINIVILLSYIFFSGAETKRTVEFRYSTRKWGTECISTTFPLLYCTLLHKVILF